MSGSLLQRKLIPEKAALLEFQTKDRIKNCGIVVLTFDLWMSPKNSKIFSMNDHHYEGLEHGFFHLGMSATTSTYNQSLANSVNLFVKIFGPENNCQIYLQRRFKLGKRPDFTWKYSKKYRNSCKLQARISDESPYKFPHRIMKIWFDDSCD